MFAVTFARCPLRVYFKQRSFSFKIPSMSRVILGFLFREVVRRPISSDSIQIFNDEASNKTLNHLQQAMTILTHTLLTGDHLWDTMRLKLKQAGTEQT